MARKYTAVTFTDSVKRAQEHYGARKTAAKVEAWDIDDERLSAEETDFLAEGDGFYMATVNEDGWPYVQHRGGPRGFLRVLNPTQLGYADFRGNTQLISVGNVSHDDRVSLILMDYPNRRRLKILGHMRVQDINDVTDKERANVELGDYRALVERVVLIDVVAFDWNCPQHISKRYTADEWAATEEITT